MNKFADKNETKKALKQLEKQLKDLQDYIMSLKLSSHENEDDAMFAKKPLGGWSCASCEKNLVNLQGNIAEYQPWNKLPFKEPSDRIAKVSIIRDNVIFIQFGPGFSKMLAMIRPGTSQVSHYASTS